MTFQAGLTQNCVQALGRFPARLGYDRFFTSAFAESIQGVTTLGATYLFDLDGGLVQSYLNPAPNENNVFGGRIVPLGQDLVAISAYEDSTSGVPAGAVYLYDIDGTLRETILNPTPEVQDWFGRTMVGIGDDQILIGASFDDTLGDNAGAAYLYNTAGQLLQTFLPPEPAPSGHFSVDMATLDDLIVIGSHFDGGGFIGPGAVYVYAPLPALPGDYNADQSVDQADLDLVLLNWGINGSNPPDGWVRNLPHALIDQQELDDVLLNWGQTTAGTISSSGVPEPGTLMLGWFAAVFTLVGTMRRR